MLRTTWRLISKDRGNDISRNFVSICNFYTVFLLYIVKIRYFGSKCYFELASALLHTSTPSGLLISGPGYGTKDAAEDLMATVVAASLTAAGSPAQLSRDPTDFRGLVLGCIEAKFCK